MSVSRLESRFVLCETTSGEVHPTVDRVKIDLRPEQSGADHPETTADFEKTAFEQLYSDPEGLEAAIFRYELQILKNPLRIDCHQTAIERDETPIERL